MRKDPHIINPSDLKTLHALKIEQQEERTLLTMVFEVAPRSYAATPTHFHLSTNTPRLFEVEPLEEPAIGDQPTQPLSLVREKKKRAGREDQR